jgi:hypothetical protein
LRGATLTAGNLSGACFANALLLNASLRGSNLGQPDISGANLAGADLRGANVSSAQLASALLCNTRMPPGGDSDRDLGTNGACASCDKGCPASEVCCDGECVNLAVDTKHRLTCDNRCPDAPPHATVRCGEVEVDGQLVGGRLYTCDDGWDDCDNAFENGCEVETRSDTTNCGICGFACPAGKACRECNCVEPGTTHGGVCPAIRNAKLIRRP